MASMFDGIDRATLIAWRSDAQNALHNLLIGDRAVQVRHNEKWVTYQRADEAKLRSYLSQLNAAIDGRPVAGGVGFTF